MVADMVADMEVHMVADMEVHMVADTEGDKVADMVADMAADFVYFLFLADMLFDMVGDMEVDKVADMVAGININKINIWIEELSIESPRVSYLTTVIFTLVAFVFANGLRLLVGQLEDTQVSLLVHHHHLHKSLIITDTNLNPNISLIFVFWATIYVTLVTSSTTPLASLSASSSTTIIFLVRFISQDDSFQKINYMFRSESSVESSNCWWIRQLMILGPYSTGPKILG